MTTFKVTRKVTRKVICKSPGKDFGASNVRAAASLDRV